MHAGRWYLPEESFSETNFKPFDLTRGRPAVLAGCPHRGIILEAMTGNLYIIATPIGNLEDITLRALRILKEADMIACEDTRHTRKLLSHYGISKPLVSYHEHNEQGRTKELIARLEEGYNVALVSDSGTPLISDPGSLIVRKAIEKGINVIPIPGASAIITAISASGIQCDEFTFTGFLPPRRSPRLKKLRELSGLYSTLIIYEAPHRIIDTLNDAREVLGDRDSVLARELTKIHEEFYRGTLSSLAEHLMISEVRGEMVLLIAPPSKGQTSNPKEDQSSKSISAEIDELVRSKNLDTRDALKRVAKSRGITRSEAYRRMVEEKSSREP